MNNKEILEKFKMNIAVNNFKQEVTNEHTLKNEWRGYAMKKKWIAGLCTGFILVSGVVVTANFDKIIGTFGLGKGIDSAVNNGYIAETNMNSIESNSQITDKNKGIILEDIKVGTKIDDFLMDDLNISTHFTFEIDTKINKTIDLDNLKSIELNDLIVTDENDNILYCMDRETFDNYCKKNNLNYKFEESNEHYYNCGLNNFIERHNKENGTINFVYNMYTGDESFPKSKKLNFKFSTITLKKADYLENENSIINVKGDWNMEFDVPEQMYNRQTISYKVVSCEEPDFKITNATVSNTGFELGIIISNIPKPEEPQLLKDLRQEMIDGKISNDEYNRIRNKEQIYREASEKYLKMLTPITTIYLNTHVEDGITKVDKIEHVTYVENENGKKFESTMSPGRRQDGNFIDGDKFSFYETFGLTTYDATDKLKVRVLYKDKPVIIELERVF